MHEGEHLVITRVGVFRDAVQLESLRGAATALIQCSDEAAVELDLPELLFVHGEPVSRLLLWREMLRPRGVAINDAINGRAGPDGTFHRLCIEPAVRRPTGRTMRTAGRTKVADRYFRWVTDSSLIGCAQPRSSPALLARGLDDTVGRGDVGGYRFMSRAGRRAGRRRRRGRDGCTPSRRASDQQPQPTRRHLELSRRAARDPPVPPRC